MGILDRILGQFWKFLTSVSCPVAVQKWVLESGIGLLVELPCDLGLKCHTQTIQDLVYLLEGKFGIEGNNGRENPL